MTTELAIEAAELRCIYQMDHIDIAARLEVTVMKARQLIAWGMRTLRERTEGVSRSRLVADLLQALSAMKGEIQRVYQRRLRSIEQRYDTDDLFQDVTMKVVQHGHQFNGRTPGEQQKYMRVVAKHACLSAIETHVGAARRSIRNECCDPDAMNYQAGRTMDPLEPLCTAETLSEVRQAMERLPARQRRALTMRAVEDRSYADMAVELGTTMQGARSLVAKARRDLSQRLGTGNESK